MIVCLIAEGCYPYITGGVSSWIHQLITGLPDIKFKILSIMPSNKENLKIKYQLPPNLLEVKTVYLNDYQGLRHRGIKKKIKLTDEEKEQIERLLRADPEVNWDEIIRLTRDGGKISNAVDFLQSDIFWGAVVNLYNNKYNGESFNTFFWTIRTMMLPFIHLMQQELLEADLYHAVSTGYAGIMGVRCKVTKNKPLVLTEHGIYAREREEEIIKAKWVTGIYKRLWIDFFYFISMATYKKADKILTLFQRNQDIQHELGAPPELTEIIANGVDIDAYSIEKEDHEGYIVGAILRIVPIKDVMTLIRAFKIVKNNIEKVKLYLIGPTDEEPEYYRQCVNLVKLLELQEDVVFTGTVDVREYLGKLDVMVLTSISEGQPLVILEAMASGIPIVATNVGSCKELLEVNEVEGACGLITNLVAPNETAAHIIKLLENPKLREEFGRQGRKRVEQYYSKNIFLTKYRAVYEELR